MFVSTKHSLAEPSRVREIEITKISSVEPLTLENYSIDLYKYFAFVCNKQSICDCSGTHTLQVSTDLYEFEWLNTNYTAADWKLPETKTMQWQIAQHDDLVIVMSL